MLATDSFAWGDEGWSPRPHSNSPDRVLGSQVEDLTIDVLDLTPQRVGRFDVVLFLGVLYHMRHPMLALERVASVCAGLLILSTSVDMLSHERPAAAFYPADTLNGDPTNWWGPNPACVTAMLEDVGFDEIGWSLPSLRPRRHGVFPTMWLPFMLARRRATTEQGNLALIRGR